MGWVCGGRQSRNGWMMNAIEGVPGTKGPFRAQQSDNCSDGTSKHNNGKKKNPFYPRRNGARQQSQQTQ